MDEWPINSETLPTGFRRGYRIDAQRVMLGADQRRDTRACGTDRLGDNAVRLDRAGFGFVWWWFLRPRQHTETGRPSDNIYVAGETIDGKAILLRPSDPPGQALWTPSISGAPLGIAAMAFDPQGNPVVLALDSRGGPSQVLKIHRGSGEILAVYTFASSNPMAVATDSAGAVYVGGGTTSAQFPVTSGAWPAYCQLDPIRAHYNCSQAFVTKLDSGLQRVVYSSSSA